MQEIKLKVKEENIEIVLSILNNLKSGLIDEIQGLKQTNKTSRYQPKLNTIIKEENSGTADTSGKYASIKTYKQKLNRK